MKSNGVRPVKGDQYMKTMTPSTTPRWMRTALSVAALAVLSLGPVSCGTDVAMGMDLEALRIALDEAHDVTGHTLDEIEAAALEQIDVELERGSITEEDARNLRDWVAERKEAHLESVRVGRLTFEEACAYFRDDIVDLAQRLEDHRNQ